MVVVRPAEPDDIGGLEVLLRELDGFYGDTTRESPAQRIVQIGDALFGSPPAAHALLAFSDRGVLTGFASYSFLWPAIGVTRSLYLKELYVRQEGRRRGIGRLLMDELVAIADERGCSRMEWTTDADNDAAQQFYQKLGAARDPDKLFYRSLAPARRP